MWGLVVLETDERFCQFLGCLVCGRLEPDLLGGCGSTDVVALGQVAAEPAQNFEGADIFNPFGDDAQSHFVTEVDGGSDNFEIPVVFTARE